MKKLFITISTLFSVLFLTSCSDWLDMPSYTSTDSNTVFSDEYTADMFVQGCYRNLIHSEMFYHLGAGETTTHSSEDAYNNSKYLMCNYVYDAMAPYTVTTIFKEQYRCIEATNTALSGLNGMPETVTRNQLIGEALAIRAFCYLNLIRIYGDVPAVWQPLAELNPDDESTFYPKRSPRDGIYDQIIADMQKAVEYLPARSENKYPTNERLTKEAGNALLARVALYAAGYSLRWDLETNDPSTMKMGQRDDAARIRELYQIADKACEDVLSSSSVSLVQAQSGMSATQNLWYNFCQRNFSNIDSEMLWHIANLGSTTNSNFGVYAQPGSRGGLYGSRKALQFILPTYYLSFNSKDERRDVNCTSYSVYFLNNGGAGDTFIDTGTTYSCIMSGKFRIGWCVEPQAAAMRNLNIPVLRLADVMLMYAETQNELNNGPTAVATKMLRDIRTRAGVSDMAIPTTKNDFFDAIVQERKWEMNGEFMLRSDFTRMNVLAREIKATQQEMLDLANRTGKYASVPKYRIYKLQPDAQVYGNKFLSIDYIDITNADEIAKITPDGNQAPDLDVVLDIVKSHGITIAEGDKWYPTNMFQAYNSAYNKNCKMTVGFTSGGANAIQVGNIIYTKPTSVDENNGEVPAWIYTSDKTNGIYYGFEENKCELLPFAAKSAGHPLVDNPNLTQHPGYL